MPGKRPNEPIGPTNIPGQALDPKIYEDQPEVTDEESAEREDERKESEPEQHARESEKAFDQAITRTPPG